MENKIQISLESQIKKFIGNRIFLCALFLMTIVSALTVYDLLESIKNMKSNVDEVLKPLENYIVGQMMLSNYSAVNVKINSFNDSNDEFKIKWSQQNINDDNHKIIWKFPYTVWSYNYKLSDIAGYQFGYFSITGSIFSSHELYYDLLIRIVLLVVFILSILFFLFPLAKKIPQKLFVVPTNRLIELLSNPYLKKTYSDSLPKELEELEIKLKSLLDKEKENEKNKSIVAIGEMATRVAHDIRSPVKSLNKISKYFVHMPERDRNEIRNSISRINDIAENLLSEYKQEKYKNGSVISSEPVVMLIDSIISEKKIQIENSNIEINFTIKENAHNVFVEVEYADFKRVLSNIIDNSIESFTDKGLVEIILGNELGKIYIYIKDNGCGIPQDKINMVFQEKVSFGKKNGSGIGLSNAANKINSWGGNYKLYSEVGKGTQFEIILPQARPASWCVNEIDIAKYSRVIVLDDDEYIHDIWKKRFSNKILDKHKIELLHCCSPLELTDLCQSNNLENVFFMLDYELIGYKENGLDLAENLNICSQSILVTSLYESAAIRERCETLKMKILPKLFSEFVPIHFHGQTDIILIDDDENITNAWLEKAKYAHKNLKIFNDVRDFMKTYHSYEKESLIYIDSSFGGNLKGEDFAKILYDDGYHNLILETGYPPENFKNIYWVKDIIGKEPPF